MRKADDNEPVQRITNAPQSLEADQKHRMIVYSIQMAIRIICLFLAVLIPNPWRWLFILGAVLLPYSAVLLANAGRDRRESQVLLMDPRQLGSQPADTTGRAPTDPRPDDENPDDPTPGQED